MPWLHAVIDVPLDQLRLRAAFWGLADGWPVGAPWQDHPELCSFEPPVGSPYLHVQRIDGPARVHLDLETDDPAATTGRAVELGAELVRRGDRWETLRSPGGLPFCMLQDREHQPPEPVTWPDGHRSRMVQVCVDSPPGLHDAEVAFWRGLLGDRWAGSRAPEFAGKWHDDAGSPLQLLFQRLGEPGGPVRAHLDHGTDDMAAEVRRLVNLGAEDLGAGRGWHVLRDPAGLPFCVTPNSPETTRVRDIG
jgi:hypothetical protein